MESKLNVMNAIKSSIAFMEKSTRAEYLQKTIPQLVDGCRMYKSHVDSVNQAKFSQMFSALFVNSFSKMRNLFFVWNTSIAEDVISVFNNSLLHCLDVWDGKSASFTTLLYSDFKRGMCSLERLNNMKKRKVMNDYIGFQQYVDENGYIIDIEDEKCYDELDLETDLRFSKNDKMRMIVKLSYEGYKKREIRDILGIKRYEYDNLIKKIKIILKEGTCHE